MKAKVVRETYAVLDGAVYPRMIQLGEIIYGDLAEVAVRDKWGTADFEEGAAAAPILVEKPAPAPEAAKPEAAASQGGSATAQADPLGPVEIPDDWRALKWPVLKALAERVKSGPISNKDEAQATIEAELAASAAK